MNSWAIVYFTPAIVSFNLVISKSAFYTVDAANDRFRLVSQLPYPVALLINDTHGIGNICNISKNIMKHSHT